MDTTTTTPEVHMQGLSVDAKRRGFLIHAAAYVVAIVLQVVINVWTGPPYWVAWVFAGWSVGLLCHWYFALGTDRRRR